jgi:hypothetical protein
MADRLRDLAMVARHREIRAELTWLADSYDRLAAQMDGSERLFGGGEENAGSGLAENGRGRPSLAH